MNKPISSVFVFSVVYCVVFRQTLKKTRRTQKQTERNRANKQKHSKTNIKTNNSNTGYPAIDPTANEYLSGSGWEISVVLFLCYVVLRVLLFVVYVCICVLSTVNAKA